MEIAVKPAGEASLSTVDVKLSEKPSLLWLLVPVFGWIYYVYASLRSSKPQDLAGRLSTQQGAQELPKERWLTQLPEPKHYQVFNIGDLREVALRARANMQGLLSSMGASDFKEDLAGENGLPSWSGVDIESLPEEGEFSCGGFQLTKEEIRKQANSLKVSYDPSVVSDEELGEILTGGSQSNEQEAKARGRMVSSLAASVCDSLGTPIQRGETLPLYRVYTSNAPNLVYSSYDRGQFIKENGALDEEKYTLEMERIFLHYFEEAQKNQDNVVVLCGFGMGAFMSQDIQPQGQRCFVNALEAAINKKGKGFEKVIFGDPNRDLTSKIAKIPGLIVSNKSCLDIAHQGAKEGYKVALFNPGDGSGIPGQFWLKGHIALEEMFGLFTSVLISQHPCCNPQVKNVDGYSARLQEA